MNIPVRSARQGLLSIVCEYLIIYTLSNLKEYFMIKIKTVRSYSLFACLSMIFRARAKLVTMPGNAIHKKPG